MKLLEKYSAGWCHPCKLMAPIFEELKKEFPDIQFKDIDIEQNEKATRLSGVSGVPTFILKEDGEETDRLVGATTKEKLVQLLIN
jgi:thioredoxin 1